MAFDKEIGCIVIACEARGGTHEERVMIGQSLFARRDLNPARYGSTVSAVGLKRYQYSEFLADAGDNSNLLSVVALPEGHPTLVEAWAAYDEAEKTYDVKTSPTHFHAASEWPPEWAGAVGVTHLGQVGNSIFYKDVP